MDTVYYSLASKGNFNKALNHFFKVTEVVDDVESRTNLADIINRQIDKGRVRIRKNGLQSCKECVAIGVGKWNVFFADDDAVIGYGFDVAQ